MRPGLFAAAFLFVALCLSFQATAQHLTPEEYLATSGAREVTPFTLENEHYLAVAQLAEDIPDTPAAMDGGNSDVDVLILKKEGSSYTEYQRIPGHGNEGAAFFKVGRDSFLAIASVRSGTHAPYNMQTYSVLYRWDGRYFHPVQQFSTFAAKQWHPFSIGKRFFLAVANGVSAAETNSSAAPPANSMIYEWDSRRFQPFQAIPCRWGYSFESFQIDGAHYLAFADHLGPSALLRWNGQRFDAAQLFEGGGGRAFKHFAIDQKHYLAYANITGDSFIYLWEGDRFALFQTLDGAGGRNFEYFNVGDKHYLFRINFITGGRTTPQTALQSPLYQWQQDRFVIVQSLPTFGGVSAHAFTAAGKMYLAIANSLSVDARFRVDSVIYRINP